VFAGLTGKGLSYLGASETVALISAVSCLSVHHPAPSKYLCNPPSDTPPRLSIFFPPASPPSLTRHDAPRTSRRHWCSAHCAAARRSGFGHFPSPQRPVSAPSLPRSLARRSLSPEHKPDPVKHHHPTRPSHYTSTFSFENPQGVDNPDKPIENIESPADWTDVPRSARDVKLKT
jgi:hypothetical protein